MSNPVKIGDVFVGKGKPLVLIAGPCVIESEKHCIKMAEKLKKISDSVEVPFVFKSSYDKANRMNLRSYRGPGLEEGLKILEKVKKKVGIPVLTDIHTQEEIEQVTAVVDVIQIPAFLCRQTDLVVKAAKTKKPLNIKKGQFISPWDMKYIIGKARSAGNNKVMVTERGYSFGYNNLVSDIRSLPILSANNVPVIFDATHSLQLPGAGAGSSGGQSEFVTYLARAAVGAGCDAVFIETHDNPSRAFCDGPNMLKIGNLKKLLDQLTKIDKIVKNSV